MRQLRAAELHTILHKQILKLAKKPHKQHAT